MKQSLRAKRMARHHRRMGRSSKLNLVSLMDIFTILVFFLLVNSSEVEVLSRDKNIELPVSVSDQQPDESLLVVVGVDQITVNGRPVSQVQAALEAEEEVISGLAQELDYWAGRARPMTETEEQVGRPITIMGDKEIPYRSLKKIMATCANSDYRNIALAVDQVQDTGGET